MAIHYLDFDLLIERSGDRYKARVLGSPAGEASSEFIIPFTPEDINNFFVQIGQTRSFETQQTRRIREFGQSLFEAVFTGAVRDRLRSSMGEANQHSNGLRIRLRLSGTPELGELPWEYLYDPGADRFLALSVETPLVRYLETPQISQPFAVQPPLRILTMICGPQDYPRLDTEQEWENLQESMRDLQASGLVDLQRLQPPTLSALQKQLRREQYHIFHFVGHGVFSKTDQDGFLMFENAQRGGQRISGRDLGTILHDHRPLRLAVLNACEGARASVEDQFAGTAQSIIQQGIPAVIAMQFRITDKASIMLAYEFYGALADGYPVDAALTEARKAIKTEGNDLEWGTPVLYMRTPDGRIFDIIGDPAPARSQQSGKPERVEDPEKVRLERLYTEAMEAYQTGEWKIAGLKFQAIVDSEPGYRDAAGRLEIAHRNFHIQDFNEQALLAEKSRNWDAAVRPLEGINELDPSFPSLEDRLAYARKQAEVGGLRAKAEALARSENWERVLGVFAEMDKLDPNHPDPTGLRAQAQESIEKARRNLEIASIYASALKAKAERDFPTALRELRRVQDLQPGYRETDQIVGDLESEMKVRREAAMQGVKQHVATQAPARKSSLAWPMLLAGVLVIGALLFGGVGLILSQLGRPATVSPDYSYPTDPPATEPPATEPPIATEPPATAPSLPTEAPPATEAPPPTEAPPSRRSWMDPSYSLVFSNSLKEAGNRWVLGDVDNDYWRGNYGFSEGTMIWRIDEAKKGFIQRSWPTGIDGLGDFDVSVYAQLIDGNPLGYGLVIRSDQTHYIKFEIAENQTYRVASYSDTAQWETWQDWTTATQIQPRGLNELGIRAQGKHLEFYINDQFVWAATDGNVWSEGSSGLFVEFDQVGTGTFRFDDFMITAP